MATLVLGLAGQALGHALMPAGFTLLGQTITGAAIGGAAGALAGAALDAMLTGSARVQGPRLKELHVQASTPGAPIARCWGTMRLAGQVIWATRFKESETRRGGGKAGPRVSEYSYTASFAVGLCEGAIGGIGRVWADGKPMALDGVVMRVHQGTEDQAPDPLIEAVEGDAPAYRGLAYVVFEDLPLEPFGNRVPQLSFEVMKPLRSDPGALERVVEAVCLIPGCGEFALATTPALRDLGDGAWQAENFNNRSGQADLEAALDQMQASLPNVKRVALVVTWFGDDLRAGTCRIRPGVESAAKVTHPAAWSVDGVARADAYVVSDEGGRPNFGGTPSDASVLQAIAALKARGLEVMLYPFLMMDIPAGNGLPDPYGGAEQARFPWRGRITCHPAAGQPGSPDKTAGAASQIAAFFGGTWGLRRMILHYAGLAVQAGGVDALLIGSELGGVTRVRSGATAYPAVTALKTLAADVRALFDAGGHTTTLISYAADWTEWAGHDPADGSGDYLFHLDPLWADGNIDFIGIDQYAPLSDWRDGIDHLDYAASPSRRAADRAYLMSRVESGERFDWYYLDDGDRAAQMRSSISDGAYGKPWVFRVKDIRNWWLNAHIDRPGGVESGATAWVPESKPVRFTELGVPAVDKGTNQPNVFFDPRSSESALPHFSDGARDDAVQRAGLEAVIGYWADAANNPVSAVYGAPMIEAGHAHVWAWDSRPYPDWPLRTELWSDGKLWRTGHWLNGRAGWSPLGALVQNICAAAGVGEVDVTALRGLVQGYALDRLMSAREALQPLMTAFAFDCVESGGTLRFVHRSGGEAIALMPGELAEAEADASAEARLTRSEAAALPGGVKASFVDALAEFQPAAAEARLNGASPAVATVELPICLTRAEADAIAARTLHEAWAARESARFAVPPSRIALEPGDAVALTGAADPFRITRVSENGVRLMEAGRLVDHLYAPPQPVLEGVLPPVMPRFGPALTAVLDIAPLALGRSEASPFLAAFGDPWPGALAVRRAGDASDAARVTRRAVLGETVTSFAAGPLNVWDRRTVLDVRLVHDALSAATERAVLDGANRAAIETSPGVWEVFQFQSAELVGPQTWRVSHLLRGQAGSEHAMVPSLSAGARFVLLDEAPVALPVADSEVGLDVSFTVGPTAAETNDPSVRTLGWTYQAAGRRPWSPCHLRARRSGNDLALSWVRRARDDPGAWTEHEVALGEERELYRVEIMNGTTVLRVMEAAAPAITYSAAMQTTDWGGPAPNPLSVRVAQISPRVGAGTARTASLNF